MRHDVPPLTHRPIGEILFLLSEEIADLSEIARDLDVALAVRDAATMSPDNQALQYVDSLHQHLSDVARMLEHLSSKAAVGHNVELTDISRVAQLDYFKRRLADPESVAEIRHHDAGSIDLF